MRSLASSAVTSSRAGISLRIAALSTVPKIARPSDPPSDRKNMIVDVTTPRSRDSTVLWATIDDVVNTDAMPNPSPIIGRNSVE
ncbi:MAG: hypothetical protein R2697_15020 [Ilumatobacteraceae bacterium]